MGYQEVIYNCEDDQSPTLKVFKYIAKKDTNPYKTIQITRHFGCGTLMFVLILIVLFWQKE